MTSSKKSDRRMLREKARRKRQRKRTIQAIGITIAGAALIAVSWYLVTGKNSSAAAIDYSPEDIIYDRPIHAIHEMEPLNLSSIPFLPRDEPQPRIAVQESFHNFGIVGPTDVVQQDFVIANTGEAPLTISRAYTTCGCTTADFTGTVIPPGMVSIMTLTFDAGYHDVRGQTLRRGIIIENNDPENPEIEIWTEVTVRSKP